MPRTKQTAFKATGYPPSPRARYLASGPSFGRLSDPADVMAYERLTMETLLIRADWVRMSDGSHVLTKEYLFSSFGEAWAYMNRLAIECERRQFYPALKVQSTTVTVTLGNNEDGEAGGGGGITLKDFEFARFADTAAEPLAMG